jgi:hypothetical protein
MSILNYNKKTLNLLNDYLNEANNQGNAFNCESTNLSSVLLKHINIIVFNDKIESNENNVVDLFASSIDVNSTLYENITNDSISSFSNIRSDYDYTGAFYYILYILIWYGLFVIILIIIQTKMSNLDEFEFSDDPRDITARNLLKRIRSEDIKKEALGSFIFKMFFPLRNQLIFFLLSILEDLRNPMFRQKIWDIYFDNPNTYKIRRVDSKRIQKIDRKLRQYYTMTGSETRPTSTANTTLNNDFFKSFDTSSLQDRPGSTQSRQFSNILTKTNENNLFLLRDMTRFETPSSFNNYYTVNSINRSNFSNSNNNSSHHDNKLYLQQFSTPFSSSPMPLSINKSNIPNSPGMNRFKVEKLSKDIV